MGNKCRHPHKSLGNLIGLSACGPAKFPSDYRRAQSLSLQCLPVSAMAVENWVALKQDKHAVKFVLHSGSGAAMLVVDDVTQTRDAFELPVESSQRLPGPLIWLKSNG